VLYLYAIADAGGALPSRAGIDERPLVPVVERTLVAVCSAHEQPRLEASRDAVRRHAAVVEALAERGAVLPARFGTAFADEEGVRRQLRERGAELGEALERVRGRVELGVRVLGDGDRASASAAGGRTYLLARLDEERRASALADELHGALSAGAVAASVRVTPAPRLLLSGAYLVERGRVDAFRSLVEALALERPELEILCTGPWPPYSFAAPERGGE
jgi:hypothetical protein